MKWNAGVLIGVTCSVLVVVGCSNESEGAVGAKAKSQPRLGADVSHVLSKGEPTQQTVACLVEGFTHSKEALDEVMQRSREAVAVQIPPAELLYWAGQPAGGRYVPAGASYCEAKLSQAERDSFNGNHYESGNAWRAKTDELRDAVNKEFLANPFTIFDAVVKARQTASATFQPSPKGEFEKMASYESRVVTEKAAFDRANGGKQVTARDVEYAWIGLFGTPRIKSEGMGPNTRLYDPDTETLSFTIVPASQLVRTPGSSKLVSHYPFEIPIKIKLTPDQAQKLFAEYPMNKFLGLSPAVVMQWHNGSFVVREVSIKDYGNASYLVEENFSRMGFKLDHIPVNIELSRNATPRP